MRKRISPLSHLNSALGKNGSYLKAEKKHLSTFPLYSKNRGKFIVPESLRRSKFPQI